MKKVLLINPWIYDFAAYNLWGRPWGLLKISAILKNNNIKVHFVDALYSEGEKHGRKNDGTGKFPCQIIDKPDALKDIPRRYKRYGISPKEFMDKLPEEKVDFIMLSSGMTYWYPAVEDTITVLRKKYGATSIILGGIYATLCHGHALSFSGADHVIRNTELDKVGPIIGADIDLSFRNILDEIIDYQWYHRPIFGILRISLGCVFDCAYCAQKSLGPGFMLKDPGKAEREIMYLYNKGIRKFAFYDDALLFDEGYIHDYFEMLISRGINADFYTPNGLHARFLSGKTAILMKELNFKNPILSLEIADDEASSKIHRKVNKKELEQAVRNLNKAGYKKGEYTVYLMLGIPGITLNKVEESMDFVNSLGGRISLSEFSPVSGTPLSRRFMKALEEPLLQNNSVFPNYAVDEWKYVQRLKQKAAGMNIELSGDRYK